MMLIRILVNAVALGALTYLFPGITLDHSSTIEGIWKMTVVAIIFGVVNAVVKPLAKTFTGCLIFLTFGLFLWVVNAAMLLVTSWLANQINIGWHVNNWSTALLGSLVLSAVSLLTYRLTARK